MQELHSLLHSLTGSEWASFQNYLTCFTTHNTSKLKYLKLAKLLMNSETVPSHDSCCIKIYGSKNEHRFDELKSDLKEKVLDFLLTDISSDKHKELDEVDYAYIRIKKMSAQYQQLYYCKPRLMLAYKLVDEIIELAKKYDYYFAVVEHLKLKRGFTGWKNNKTEFEIINNEIEEYLIKTKLLIRIEYQYQHLNMLYGFSEVQEKQKIMSLLGDAIAEAREGYKLTKSPTINYYLAYFELALAQLNKNRMLARSACLKMLEIVRNNKSVYRRQRVGVVYDNLSRCEFYLGNLEQAAENAREAQKHFNLNSENYCIALEQEYYALFAMKRYESAAEVATRMITSAARKELGVFRFSKYNYLLANALFKLGRYTETLKLLSNNTELSKDKSGWETGIRILKIMTLIETLKLDNASQAVSNLKRFFSRTEGISPRNKKILNLLLIAERKGFMFTMLNGNTDKYMKKLGGWSSESGAKTKTAIHSQLSTPDSELNWEPFTPEVIPFHEWYSEKMKRSSVNVEEKAKGAFAV